MHPVLKQLETNFYVADARERQGFEKEETPQSLGEH